MANKSFDHLEAPSQFKYRDGKVVLRQSYKFVCDNRIYFTSDKHQDLHDHQYNLYVDVESPIDDTGLGLDFNEVDDVYKEHIEPKVNHQLLNETLTGMNTTAENIAMWMWDQFEERLPEGNHMFQLQLFESEEHGVLINQELMTNIQ